jgi:WD40 repeat protein
MKKKYILSKLLFMSFISSITPQTQTIPILDPGSPTDFISALLPTQSGKTLIAVAADKTVRVINAANGETSKIWRTSISPGLEGELFAADLSPSGQWLAVGGNIGPCLFT